MAVSITGEGLGTYNSSLDLLNQQNNDAKLGRQGNQVYINSATGNLVLRQQDEYLSSQGLDVGLVRTYNSLGQFNDDNGDNWRLNINQSLHSLTGTVNTAGSTITKTFGDGFDAVYTYDAATGSYLSTTGDGAHDVLRYDSSTGQWHWHNGDSRVSETYNAGLQLIAQQDADGNTTSYVYTGSLISEIHDASGQVTYLDYAGNNLSAIRTVSNAVTQSRVQYVYDTDNRLSQVIVDLSPEDNSIVDGKIYTTTYTYDGTSTRIASISASDGTSLAFTYDAQGRVETYTDGAGGLTRYAYDDINHKTDVTDPLGHITTYTTDSTGNLIEVNSPAVNGSRSSTFYSYDSDGNVAGVTDANGNQTVYSYDAHGNLTQQQDSLGNTVRYVYDADNHLLNETVYLTPDPDGLDPQDTGLLGSPTQPLTTRYVYDTEGHLRFSISAEGQVSEQRYAANGQRLSTIVYTTGVYDVSVLTETDTLSETQLTTWLSSQDLSQSQRSDYSYDFRGQVSSTTTYAGIDALGNGISDGTQATTQFIYDQAGQLLQRIDARGVATTTIADDGITHFNYDGLGRLTSTTNALGQATLTNYDDANQRIVTTLVNGLATTSVYDARGLLISETQTAPDTTVLGTTTYHYDTEGKLRYTQD